MLHRSEALALGTALVMSDVIGHDPSSWKTAISRHRFRFEKLSIWTNHTTWPFSIVLKVYYLKVFYFFLLDLITSGFSMATRLLQSCEFSSHTVCGNALIFAIKHSCDFYCLFCFLFFSLMINFTNCDQLMISFSYISSTKLTVHHYHSRI